MSERSLNILACLVETEGLTTVLIYLTNVCAGQSAMASKKSEAKAWDKVCQRVGKLRLWCDEFGPGSDCK